MPQDDFHYGVTTNSYAGIIRTGSRVLEYPISAVKTAPLVAIM